MSEQRPESDEFDVASSGAPTGSFSANGTYGDAAVAIAEETEAEAAEEPTASADEPAAAEATAEEHAPPAEEPTAEAPLAADDGTTFLADLARAMQATAGLERKRIEEDADRRREAHLAAIQERRESQAATMRELAAEDLKGIDAWAESERERIAAERDRRAADLQADLETSLTEHGAKIDREVQGVETAIATYRTEVAGFFATLGQESDPVEIARHASRRPTFPDLDAVGATDADAVGVMDLDSAHPDPAVAWSQWNEEQVVEATTATTEPASAEPVPVAPEPVAPSGTVLQSVPVHRPFSFLRGDRQENE